MPLSLTTCTVDLDAATVTRPDQPAKRLTAHEVGLLRYLSERPHDTVSRDTLLQEVWGYSKNVATRAVDLAMARLRRKVEALPRQPAHLISVYGEGYQFVPGDAPIPAARTRLFGRTHELQRLDQWTGRLLTLTGPAGIGKTRLALTWAASQSAVVVDIGDEPPLGGVSAAVGDALGAASLPDDDNAAADAVSALLGARGPLLLVIDNADAVANAGPTLAAWLDANPKLRVLITSRRRMDVRGELVVPVGPLPQQAAEALLRDRASAASGREPGSLDDLTHLLEGIPLAIELAGCRLRARSPIQLAQDLQKRGPLRALGKAPSDADARHTTLTRAIEVSWQSLTHKQQQAWMAASHFEHGFSAHQLAMVLDLDESDVLDEVEALVDASVVTASEHERLPGELRFALLDAVRAFGIAQPSDEPYAKRMVHTMASIAQDAATDLYGSNGLWVAAMLQVERVNLLGATSAALRLQDTESLTWLLPVFLFTPVGLPLGVRPLVHAARQLEATPLQQARLLAVEASLLSYDGDREGCIEALTEALATAKTEQDTTLTFRCLANLGQLLSTVNQHHEALGHIEEALAFATQAGNRLWQAYGHVELAMRLLPLERGREARSAMSKADALSRALGRPAMLEVRRLSVHSDLQLQDGQIDASRATTRSLRDLYDHPRLQYLTSFNLGRAAHTAGDLEEAATELQHAVDIAEASAFAPRRDEARYLLAAVQLDAREFESAIENLRQVLAFQVAPAEVLVRAQAALAACLARTGRHQEAAEHMHQAMESRDSCRAQVVEELQARQAVVYKQAQTPK